MLLMVGAVFTAFTVSRKVSFAVSDPSETVTVIVAVPLWPAAGVTVRVREAPEPPSTRPDGGTRVVLHLLASLPMLTACIQLLFRRQSMLPLSPQ